MAAARLNALETIEDCELTKRYNNNCYNRTVYLLYCCTETVSRVKPTVKPHARTYKVETLPARVFNKVQVSKTASIAHYVYRQNIMKHGGSGGIIIFIAPFKILVISN